MSWPGERSAMTDAATTRSLKLGSLADRLNSSPPVRTGAGRTVPLSQLPDIRAAIQDLRTEAENREYLGGPALSGASAS